MINVDSLDMDFSIFKEQDIKRLSRCDVSVCSIVNNYSATSNSSWYPYVLNEYELIRKLKKSKDFRSHCTLRGAEKSFVGYLCSQKYVSIEDFYFLASIYALIDLSFQINDNGIQWRKLESVYHSARDIYHGSFIKTWLDTWEELSKIEPFPYIGEDQDIALYQLYCDGRFPLFDNKKCILEYIEEYCIKNIKRCEGFINDSAHSEAGIESSERELTQIKKILTALSARKNKDRHAIEEKEISRI